MTISETQATILIDKIEGTIAQNPNDYGGTDVVWVLSQWRQEVATGRPVYRRLKVNESPGIDVLAPVERTARKTSGDFVGKEPYSKTEELDLLVGALALAKVAPPRMATKLFMTIEKFSDVKPNGQITVHLIDPLDETNDGRTIDRSDVDQAISSSRSLATLLQVVSEEIGTTKRTIATEGVQRDVNT